MSEMNSYVNIDMVKKKLVSSSIFEMRHVFSVQK